MVGEDTLEKALEAEELIIYGAHLVALECARWLIKNGKRNKLRGFAVTDIVGNPRNLAGFPVKKIEEYQSRSQSLTVIIATPEKYHDEIECYLKGKGFYPVFKAGLECMSRIKGRYLVGRQRSYPYLPFILEENDYDPSWLDMVEKNSVFSEADARAGKNLHCKFPALFYLEEETVFEKAAYISLSADYEKICGCYRDLHAQPVFDIQKVDIEELCRILNIYMVCSKGDSIKTAPGQNKPWIYPIQAGSALADQVYEKLSDDTGDSISDKNRLFAEMTGAYWVWKNRTCSKYKGICHYRRHFIISEEEILSLDRNGTDVILTTPRYVPGGIRSMFLAETPVNEQVYETLLDSISELSPEDREAFECYMDRCFYYPNNMVAARNEIYDSYCSWVFPILFRMEEIDAETGYKNLEDRHIAYAAELLTSYYFVKNKDKYCITVTDYQFLSLKE